jgi:ABC-type glycerol-3-phosphate transport system substrate-binding protein
MSSPFGRRRYVRTAALAAAGTMAMAALAACSSGSGSTGSNGKYGFPEAAQSSGGKITVWVDSDRIAAANAFKKANPSVPINVVTYDGSANGSNSFKTKIGLLDRAGSGWPDVVFSTQNNDAAWASQKTNGKQAFAAVLDKGLVPKDILSGFTKGALNPCTVEGKVYCLRNDLAQNVLWFNKKLMDQFGYSLPKSWEEYQSLSAKIAADHPGYLTGSVGDTWTPEVFMWASECGANQVTGPRAVTVDTTSANCQRAAKLIDAGVKNKTLTTLSVFTPDFAKKYTGKVLMMPGPAWFAGAVFNSKTGLNVPAGQLGVAAPLPWGTSQPVTGDVGGGTWFISSHSKNLAAAEKFAQFVTTDDAYQVNLAPGYPAYAAAGAKWITKQQGSNYYATSLDPIIQAGSQIWTGWGSAEFSQEAIWAKTMTPVINSGQSVAANLQKWQDAIKNQAQVTGYSVK